MDNIKSYNTIWYYFAEEIHCMVLNVGTDQKSQTIIFLKGVIWILTWSKILVKFCPHKPNAEVSFKKLCEQERITIIDLKK